jgi:hypothetical protein
LNKELEGGRLLRVPRSFSPLGVKVVEEILDSFSTLSCLVTEKNVFYYKIKVTLNWLKIALQDRL